jgi:hypothetical protein
MNNRKRPLGLLVALPLLLTACTSADATTGHAIPTTTHSSTISPAKSPGMSMAPGESMPGMTSKVSAPASKSIVNADSPSVSAKMICGPETARNVATLMGLHTPAPTKTSWVDHLYTCTYQLPVGPLVLSVKESPNAAAARNYFKEGQSRLGHTKTLTGLSGLGLPAYENTTGIVVFLKDNMTLQVDSSALPAHFGAQNTTRADLAYAVATDVLACWTGK